MSFYCHLRDRFRLRFSQMKISVFLCSTKKPTCDSNRLIPFRIDISNPIPSLSQSETQPLSQEREISAKKKLKIIVWDIRALKTLVINWEDSWRGWSTDSSPLQVGQTLKSESPETDAYSFKTGSRWAQHAWEDARRCDEVWKKRLHLIFIHRCYL